MTTNDFDQALEAMWALDSESPSETEEREVIEAGRVLDIMTDSEHVEADDEAAEDYAEAFDPSTEHPRFMFAKY